MKIGESLPGKPLQAVTPTGSRETTGGKQAQGREQLGAQAADRGEWSTEAQEQLRFGRLCEALDQLQGQHRETAVIIVPSGDSQWLREQAAALGPGRYLLLTQSFLQSMQGGEEQLQQGLERISQALERLGKEQPGLGVGALLDEQSGTFWHLVAQEKEQESPFSSCFAKSEDTAASAAEKLRVSVNINQLLRSPSRIIGRIASARGVFDVQNAQLWARRAISDLKFADLMAGEEKMRTQIRNAVRKLERALRSGNQKIHDLQRIQLLKKQKQRAEERLEQRKARRTASQLDQSRSERKRRDWGLRKEASDYEAERQLGGGDYSADTTSIPEIGMGDLSMGAVGAGVDVILSPE